MIRRVAAGMLAAGASVVAYRAFARRAGDRLLAAPRMASEEAGLGPALDALGGEVVRIRSRDGLQLGGRWLPAERSSSRKADRWRPDPHEAILLLHGWSGSSAPDLVALGPFLRRTAGVLGLDLRGHGVSDDSPATFGLREVDDVAGALAWLGGRGIERVAIVGRSMGGITAIASVAVLGDGRLSGVDADPAPAAHVGPPIRPRIVAVVADSVPPRLAVPVAARMPVPAVLPGRVRRALAEAALTAAAARLGGDPRETEPVRVIGLLEGVPLLLIWGGSDPTIPLDDARGLMAAAPPGTRQWIVPDAGHDGAHAAEPADYEARVTEHLQAAFTDVREARPIIAGPSSAAGGADGQASSVED
jgi:pimeloyl-ACP methyl ester carboxylesterase